MCAHILGINKIQEERKQMKRKASVRAISRTVSATKAKQEISPKDGLCLSGGRILPTTKGGEVS
jgi:hypothetical protein